MNSQGSTAIQAFVFPETNHKIRVFIDPDGTLWFVAADVCRELGYAKVWNAIKQHCKPEGTAKRSILTNGGMQEVTVIDERNLYRLMGKSEAPNADPFQDWFYGEVLPSIRKTGSYGHKPQPEFDPSDPHQLLPCLLEYTQRTIQLEAEKAKLETKLEAQTPVVHAYKRLAASEGSVCIQEAAKALKMPPKELTEHMLKADWLYMRPPSTRKIAYQAKIKQGWMVCHEDKKPLADGRELFFVQYKVTGLGLLRLARELEIDIEEIQ